MSVSAVESLVSSGISGTIQELAPLKPEAGSSILSVLDRLSDSYSGLDKVLSGPTLNASEIISAQKELSLLHFRLTLLSKTVDAASAVTRRLQNG